MIAVIYGRAGLNDWSSRHPSLHGHHAFQLGSKIGKDRPDHERPREPARPGLAWGGYMEPSNPEQTNYVGNTVSQVWSGQDEMDKQEASGLKWRERVKNWESSR